ncbi:glycosyltransferase family 2 protein [Marivirga sp.]|uniref:glycosyltransferase family 2 protein n=1 Tax=Marivirga sp. TaxID=2018662 RepID=UPI0025FA5680|nr:glycosyltransferase family 2 protein [Marivirga sp.]
MESKFKIAALLTCHNRRDKTLLCLEALSHAALMPGHKLDIYLVDDGSTDGTGEAVKSNFPEVNVIQGDGSLFWNQGMRLAWNTASQKAEYDFHLWLNDDTMLSSFALIEVFESYQEASDKDKQPAIVVGACESSAGSNEFSYGGKDDSGPVVPNGKLQICTYINGNVVLVSKAIFEKLGNLSNDYTHAMGDIDYGLRAIQAGFICYTTRKYIAVCAKNDGIPAWCDPQTPISKRWKLMNSPTGLNLKEYNTFRRKFWGWRWTIYTIKAYLKALMPGVYNKANRKKSYDSTS